MNHDKKFYACLSLALAETIALLWFSALPSVETIPTGGFTRPGDLDHFAAYAVYGFLWAGVFRFLAKPSKTGRREIFLLLLPVIIGSAVGAASEAMQLFVPTRTADVLDWLTDTAGSSLGAVVALKFKTLI